MPTANRKSGGANTGLTMAKRKSGGVMVDVANGYRRNGGVWTLIWPVSALVQVLAGSYLSSGSVVRTSGVRFNTSGAQEKRDQTAYTNMGSWLLSGLSSAYDIRATLVSGSVPNTGTMNTWENLATSREWTVTDGTADLTSVTSTILFEIRPAGGGATLASNNVTITADRI